MCFCTLKMLVKVIEQSDGCILYPSAGPRSKLYWVKMRISFITRTKLFITIEVKGTGR